MAAMLMDPYSNFGQAFINGQLNIPDSKTLPNYPQGAVLSDCIVADEASSLRMDLMRPFPRGGRMQLPDDERIFNYRLSRACCIVCSKMESVPEIVPESFKCG